MGDIKILQGQVRAHNLEKYIRRGLRTIMESHGIFVTKGLEKSGNS